MAPASRLLREPLVHFLVAGAILFALFSWIQGPGAEAEDETTIAVDRATLLTYLQYRANAFEPQAFNAILDAMTEQERQALIDAYVEEEILYREAAALNLDDSDYVIRQRMIQKARFLIGDIALAGEGIDEEALREYYLTHRAAYMAQPSVTFTHVFFDPDRRGGMAEAEADAAAVKARLQAAGAGFNDAGAEGDRFPFLKNYVERTFDYVASHFGEEFAAELAPLEASETEWRGPYRSAYGLHLVMLTRRTEASLPPLDAVRDQVEQDFLRERSDASVKEMIASLKDRYRVQVDLAAPEVDAMQASDR